MASLELSVEALIATTGIYPDHPVSLKDIAAAEKLPQVWAGKIKAWLDASAPLAPPKIPPVDYLKTWAKLAAPPDDSELAAGLGDQVRMAYLQGLATARAYLRSVWAPLYRDTPLGREIFPAGVSEEQRASAYYAIVNDPSLVLADLAANSLTSEVITSMEKVDPALLQMAKSMIDAELIRHRERKGYRVAWWQESALRQLLGMPPGQPMQPLPAAPPKAQLPKVEINTAKAEKLRTKAEQVAAA